MPTILLIRHGENDYVEKGRLAGRLQGVHLNEKGRAQAEKLAELLAKAPVKAVYSSPLERTMETAEPIARALGMQVTPRDGLLEIDFGDWQDGELKELKEQDLWKVVQYHPSLTRFPNGETFAEAQGRGVREIETLCQQHDPKDMFVCVTHSDLIKLLTAYYLGLPLDMFQRLLIFPASITTLHVGHGGARLVHINHSVSFNLPKPEKEHSEDEADS
ncbi:MAG: MSMEG_4193 family putative phosphomutase [Anaerolineales bacterium]|jgi:probable phosphoglycerate mutase